MTKEEGNYDEIVFPNCLLGDGACRIPAMSLEGYRILVRRKSEGRQWDCLMTYAAEKIQILIRFDVLSDESMYLNKAVPVNSLGSRAV